MADKETTSDPDSGLTAPSPEIHTIFSPVTDSRSSSKVATRDDSKMRRSKSFKSPKDEMNGAQIICRRMLTIIVTVVVFMVAWIYFTEHYEIDSGRTFNSQPSSGSSTKSKHQSSKSKEKTSKENVEPAAKTTKSNEKPRQFSDKKNHNDNQNSNDILSMVGKFERKLKGSWDLSKFSDVIKPLKVNSIEWEPGAGFLQRVVSHRAPVKIAAPLTPSAAPVADWTILSKSFDLLAFAESNNISLPNTRYKTDSSVFVLANERDKGGMLGKKRSNLLMYTDTTFNDLLKSSLRDNHYMYWTGELSSFESSLNFSIATSSTANSSLTNTSWRQFKVVETGMRDLGLGISSEDAEFDEIWTPMLWISHPGVVAQTHYDTQHNFFVQLEGVKRFHMLPPTVDSSLFPNIHRSYRQSQIRLEQFNSSEALVNTFPNFIGGYNGSKLGVYELIVYPGDVVYIPPYWQHRVESLTFSISLSVLSPSLVESALARAYWHPVPFGAFQNNPSSRILATTLYLTLLFNRTSTLLTSVGLSSVGDAARYLYSSRFSKLYPFSEKELKQIEGFCNPVRINSTTSSQNYNGTIFDQLAFDSSNSTLIKLVEMNLPKFTETAEDVSTAIEDVVYVYDSTAMNSSGDSGVKSSHGRSVVKEFMADYLEQLVRFAVGADNTPGFIRVCLQL